MTSAAWPSTSSPLSVTASSDASLMEVSDAPVMHKLGFYREA